MHGYTWLHGVKAGRMVHVGAVDAPVSVGDVTQIAAEFGDTFHNEWQTYRTRKDKSLMLEIAHLTPTQVNTRSS